MKKAILFSRFLILFLTLFSECFSQSVFVPVGIIYKDNYVSVELQYKQNNPCSENGKNSKFRYNITGKSRGYDLFLSWKMDYYNCTNSITTESSFLNIGKLIADGLLENIDWNFPGDKLSVPYYDITISTTPDTATVKPKIFGSVKQPGKYYGLVIGVSEYNNSRLNLDEPSKDAKKIKEILVNRYSFADSTTSLVLNPTRQKILSELFRLRKVITPEDNLLIFFAGHGYWDEQARQGYWWPKDATIDDPSNWLSNSDLREQIRSIKSAHTLLISDACFSGGIFKTRGDGLLGAPKDIQSLYGMPSRRAMTSGTMTVVPDKSVFLEFLCKRLTDNKAKFFSAQSLFDSFRAAVINNSNAVPQDGVIADTGDEGGDFIFILKEN